MEKSNPAASTHIKPAKSPIGDVLVYEYGCRVDTEAVAHINQQIALSRKLYNDLVACIRNTVDELKSFVISEAGDGAKQLQSEIDLLNEKFLMAKANDDEPSMQDIAQQRREKWRELSVILKETRKNFEVEISQRFLSKISKKADSETGQIRKMAINEGLSWATATVVLNSALIAFKKSFAQGRSPRFTQGSTIDQDCLSLQFTNAGGVPSESVLSGRLHDLSMTSNNFGRRAYGEFKFRLGAAKANVYATGTWQYHRALPEGSNIAMARLVRRRVSSSYKWAIQLIVKTKQPINIKTSDRLPLVTVHFGWSADVSGRRVASLSDCADPSASTIVSLPGSIEEGLERAAQIQSQRDSRRDEIAPMVKLISVPENANEDLLEIIGKMRKTRPQDISANRLHYLCRLLRDDDSLPEWLETWRKNDKLEWQAQTHIARRARNARKSFYLEQSINLAKRYAAIAIEPLDLASAAIKVDQLTGKKTDFSAKARSGRVVAALYEFESALRWAAVKTGAAIIDITAATATQCSICSGQTESDKDNHQVLICTECGAVLDRKQNGSAMAWQLVNDVREDVVTSYWLDRLASEESKTAEKAIKQQKLADARKKSTGITCADPE